jgi:hypothetical protein
VKTSYKIQGDNIKKQQYVICIEDKEFTNFCFTGRASKICWTCRDPHCKEIWIYVFPEMELRCLSPNFRIHVSVSDLYRVAAINPEFFSSYFQMTQHS